MAPVLEDLDIEYLATLEREVRSSRSAGRGLAVDAADVTRSKATEIDELYPAVGETLERHAYDRLRAIYTTDRRWDRDLIPEIRRHLKAQSEYDVARRGLADVSLGALRALGLALRIVDTFRDEEDEGFANLSDDDLERLDRIFDDRLSHYAAAGADGETARRKAAREVYGYGDVRDEELDYEWLTYPREPDVLIPDARRVWEHDPGFREWAGWIKGLRI